MFKSRTTSPRQRGFSQNQHLVLNIANELFANSSPLDLFEQRVLNNTFNRIIKKTPTLSGRK
jgi:hypothetical protein